MCIDMQRQPSDRFIKSKVLLSLLLASLTAPLSGAEFYDDKKVSHIEIIVESGGDNSVDSSPIRSRMKTQEGDSFSQLTFDNDLKTLSEEYDLVDPTIKRKDGQVSIEIHVVPMPVIHKNQW